MSGSQSGIQDYVAFLQSLGMQSHDQFLIGGQAVNFWAEHLGRSEHSAELNSMRPFTSKDCDVGSAGSFGLI